MSHKYFYVAMGWIQSVGSLKSLVSFTKEPRKRDDILQKRPVILRSLLLVATLKSCLRSISTLRWNCTRMSDPRTGQSKFHMNPHHYISPTNRVSQVLPDTFLTYFLTNYICELHLPSIFLRHIVSNKHFSTYCLYISCIFLR